MRRENIEDIYHAIPPSKTHVNHVTKFSPLEWHHKLGHPSIKVFKHIVSLMGLSSQITFDSSVHCASCSINKSHKLPFGPNSFVTTKPLQLVYSDVWGPVQKSVDNFQYYVLFVDFHTKYVWLYPIKRKSDVAQLFPQFKTLVEKFLQTPLISLFTDNGGEYQGLSSYLKTHGISHYTTPPHTPEQNGIADRHIVETGLSLLHYAKLPLHYWSHAFQTVIYLINRLLTTILNHKIPYEALFNQALWLSLLSLAKAIHHIQTSAPSSPCIFIGYSTSKSAYKCYDLGTLRLYHSRHVQFIDSTFPSTKSFHSSQLPTVASFLSPSPSPHNFPSTPPTSSSSPPLVTPLPSSSSNASPTPIQTSVPPTPPYSSTTPQSPTVQNHEPSLTYSSHTTIVVPSPEPDLSTKH